jgi:hypothetical protein
MIPNHPIRRALWIAAIYLLMSVVLHALRQRGLVSAGTVVRLTGMVTGIVVLVAANAIPKRLVPLARLSCDPAREQALRRLAGWALVLGGLGYTLAYALAPIAIAGKLANSLLAPAGIVVAGIMVYCVWMRVSARRRGT